MNQQRIERTIEDEAAKLGLPMPETACFDDTKRQKTVMKIWFRHNMEKYQTEIMYSPTNINSHARDMIGAEIQDSLEKLLDCLLQQESTVRYKGALYMMSWKGQDYFQVECMTCSSIEWFPYKDRHFSKAKRDAVMCYLLGKIGCGCQDLRKK